VSYLGRPEDDEEDYASSYNEAFCLEDVEVPEGLTEEQEAAFVTMRDSHNVFLAGEAGTGKTFLVNAMREALPRDRYPVVAPTGVAALLAKGCTIHRAFGIGRFDGDVKKAVSKALSSRYVYDFLRSIDGLFIDEISMASGKLLTVMEKIARAVKKEDAPWGGLKIIAIGDFRQLPPVPDEEMRANNTQQRDWAFLSQTWDESNFTPAVLRTSIRQEDAAFSKLINRIRVGDLTLGVRKFLDDRVLDHDDETTLRLVGTNAKADGHNQRCLSNLPGELVSVDTIYEGNENCFFELKNKSFPIGETLDLKVGARVMLRENHPEMVWVNGSTGTLLEIQLAERKKSLVTCRETQCKFVCIHKYTDNSRLKIQLDSGAAVWVGKGQYCSRNSKGYPLAYAENFPLSLAWAITIHKSQGCTLDKAVVGLRNLWEPGHAYVAISRVRSPEGLFVEGWDNRSLKLKDPDVDVFYRKLLKDWHGNKDKGERYDHGIPAGREDH